MARSIGSTYGSVISENGFVDSKEVDVSLNTLVFSFELVNLSVSTAEVLDQLPMVYFEVLQY